jgi:hypothetical protein
MNMRIAAVPIIAAAMLLTACGLDGRFDAGIGESASAHDAGSVGLSTAVRSLPEGHPPVRLARPNLPEGHPPIPFSGPALPQGHPPIPFSGPGLPGSQRALPDGHPRCPARGVVPAGPLERGPARPLSEPPAVISI